MSARYWFLFPLLMFVMISPEGFATSGKSDLETRLTNRYNDVQTFTADIIQKKTSPHLFKPLKSRVRLTYTPDKIVWQIVEPVLSTATLDDQGMTLEQDGKVQKMSGKDQPQLASLIRVLRAILKLDFKTIREHFVLEFTADELAARARTDVKDGGLIKRMNVRFKGNLEPKSMYIETNNEQTDLTFSRIVISTVDGKGKTQ